MTLTELIAEYGAYYRNSPAAIARILKLLHQPTVTEQYFTTVLTDETVWQAAQSRITSIVQRFQIPWTPKGTIEFTPMEIGIDHLKIDVELFPDEIEETWLGFLADNGHKRSEWPLVRYVVEELIIPQIKEDVELYEIYKGVKAPIVNGVPNATGTNMNGIEKRINDGLTAGTINEIAIGAITPGTTFDKVELFTAGINGLKGKQPMNIFASETLVKNYYIDRRNSLGLMPSYDKGNPGQIDFTNKQLVALPSMGESMKMWASPKPNMIRLAKKNNKSSINIEELKRQVFLMTDWYESVGFAFNELVWASDTE